VPDDVESNIPAPSGQVEVNGRTIGMTVTPGGPGINSYDIHISGADADSVRVRHVFPELDARSASHPADMIEGGLYATTDADISRVGRWWSLVDVREADGTLTRAAFVWDIRAEAAIEQSRPPSLVNLALMALTLAALVAAFYPPLMRFGRRLDLSTTMISVGVWATVGTVIFMVAGYAILEESQRSYQAVLAPPPQMVNPTLPTQESLESGQRAFAESCAGWEGVALDELRQRLPRTRDEELFAFVGEGWRALPACTALDALTQWDVVNYVRTFEG
jgi:hypothetical protein